eukprot:196343_1
MLVTQTTTFFAFLATSVSPIMPISAFGIWAATVVAMNYVLVITVYPSVLVIHHKYIKQYETACLCFCCNLCSKRAKNQRQKYENGDIGDDGQFSSPQPQLSRQLSVEEQAEEYRKFERFLGTKFATFIGKWRRLILAIFCLLFIGGAILSFQMEAQSEEEQWFPDEHFMQKIIDQSGEFSASSTDNLIQMRLTWGIKGVDRDEASKWDPEDYGEV